MSGQPLRPDDERRVGVAIIGGGISGLSAAHRLDQRGAEAGHGRPYLVLEAESRLGGRIETLHQDSFLIEAGPDSLVTQKPTGLELCRELGIDRELVAPRATTAAATSIVHRGRLRPLPEGLQMVVPTRARPVLGSSLFSARGKAALLAERFRRPRTAVGDIQDDDEALGEFITRRFGREAFERVVEPIVGGLFCADAAGLSVALTAPRLREFESRWGSVTRGTLQALKVAARGRAGSPPPPAQVALAAGMGRLVERLAESLDPAALETDTKVQRILFDRTAKLFRLELEHRPAIESRAVILACPGPAASALLRDLDRDVGGDLAADAATLDYASCATVHLGYPRRALASPLVGFGFFACRGEGLPLLACSFASEKFPGRAPEDAVLLRVFVGGACAPEMVDLDDRELVTRVTRALGGLLPLTGSPHYSRVIRHPRAIPQFVVGYGATIQRLRAGCERWPGLAIAGSLLGAYGLADCIASGLEAADRATSAL